MRDFKEFLNGDVVVTFSSEEEVKEFLKLCESKNITWRYGDPAIAHTPNFKSDGIRFDKYERGMCKGSIVFYKTRGSIKFIPASKFLVPEERVEIFRSKNTVVCLKRVNGKVVAKGVARCCPSDVFDFDYGASLAFERMLGKKSVKTPKIVKQKLYCVGDKVLIKKKWKSGMQESTGLMDKYLDTVMTIREVVCPNSLTRYKMEGDQGCAEIDSGWNWYPKDFKGKVI